MVKKEALKLENISFSYEGKRQKALDSVALTFCKGEFVGIIGPVGSGKSTLLYCCNGLIPKEIHGSFEGSVKLFGRDIANMGFPEISQKASMVFQDPNDQIFNLTLEEEVAFGLQNRGIPRQEALASARAAIARVGLEGRLHDDPSELSSGQKQKVAIACALAADSKIILLDEPVSSLDWRSSQEVYAMLDALVKEGRTVIATEQDTCLLSRHATRIIVIDDGKIVKDGGVEVLSSSLIEKMGLRPPIDSRKTRCGIC